VDEPAWVTVVVVSVGRGPYLRPARLVTTYSQNTPRLMQRAQEGFCLLHLTLEAAHASQLSRSLGAAGTVELLEGLFCPCEKLTNDMIKLTVRRDLIAPKI
jgi:hypothetical protein